MRSRSVVDWMMAAMALAAILAHDAAHVVAGRYWDVFWICNVSALFVTPAILFRAPLLAAVALTWLVPGTLVWLADAFVAGSNILPTSYAVHIGGTLAALYAARVAGFSRRGWLFALGVLAACVLFSRLFLPAGANVNAAHSVPKGWAFLGRGRATFFAVASVLALAACWLGRALGRAVAADGPAGSSTD